MAKPISTPTSFPNCSLLTCPANKLCSEHVRKSWHLPKCSPNHLTAAAWKAKPSWAVVAGNDQIINSDLERWYYKRAKSHTIEIKGASHSVYVSHPKEVAAVITEAARKVETEAMASEK